VTALLVLGAGLALELLVRIDLTDADDFVVLDADTFGQVFVMSKDLLIFGGVVPLFIGLALYVVPLQIGAPNLAFPRAGLLSFWGWFASGGLLITSYSINGGPYGGEPDGVDLYMLALAGVFMSLLLASVSLAATVLTMRAPRLFLDVSPPFAWSALISAAMLMVTLPVALAQLALLYVDHRYGRLYMGGNFGVFEQLEWLYRTPQLYVYAVPALGAVAELVPVWSKARQVQSPIVAYAIGAFGLAGFGAASQLTNEPLYFEDYQGLLNVVLNVLALLAVLGLLGVWAVTLARSPGLPRLDAAFLSGLAAGFMFLVATVQAVLGVVMDWSEVADREVDLLLTTWTSASQALMLGAVLLAGFAALAFWAPKIWGRRLNEPISLLALLVAFAGALLAGVGPAVAGAFQDQPYLVFDDPNLTSTYVQVVEEVGDADAFSAIGAVGIGLLLAAVALLLLNMVISLLFRVSAVADADPWGAQTAEWALPSPPAMGPLDELPDLVDGAPLLTAPGTPDEEAAGELEAAPAEEVPV
jgi:heme/copper-type cytochrome/quinol oxidase subunit 1